MENLIYKAIPCMEEGKIVQEFIIVHSNTQFPVREILKTLPQSCPN